MASGSGGHPDLHQGQLIEVQVDSFTRDLVAVTFSDEGKVYRGILLAEKERSFAPDVNEQRVFGTPQWPPPVGLDSCLSMKTAPCSIERYSYKADGQPSQLTVFQPGSKRTSHNLSHRFPRVLRPREFVCRKCKKSFPLDDPKSLSTTPLPVTSSSSDAQSSRVLRTPSSTEAIRQSTTTTVPNVPASPPPTASSEIRHVTPPIYPKLESCFKSKETGSSSDADNGSAAEHKSSSRRTGSSSDADNGSALENKPSSRRKGDHHKRSSRSPSQPTKKRRDTVDTDPVAVAPVEPSAVSTPELQDKVSPLPKPPSHHFDVLESGPSPVPARKDRIKAQYQSSSRTHFSVPAGRRHNSSRHLSTTDLSSNKSRKPGRKRVTLGSPPSGESLNGSLADSKNSDAPIKAKVADSSTATTTKESGTSSEPPKSGPSQNGVNPAPKTPLPSPDDGGIQRPAGVTRETTLGSSSTSVPPEVPPTSPRLTSASGRRRSGCYEKPKNRWIRAERIRDTEEAGKSPTPTPSSSAPAEKRRKLSTDSIFPDASVVSSSRQKVVEAALPQCTPAPDEAGTANTDVSLPPPDTPDYEVVSNPTPESTFIPPIKIKINRNAGQLKGRSKVGQTDVNGFEAKLVSESSPKQPECVKDLPTASSDTDDRPKTNPDETLPVSAAPKQPPGISNSGRRFVRRYKLPDGGSVFRLGDIVWCKLSGWPFWPARITSIAKEEATGTACVRWFAWDQVSYMACDKLWPFLEHYDKKLDRRKKRGAYKQAVDQALEAARSREQELQTKAKNAGEESGSDDDGSGWVKEGVAAAKSVPCTDEPITENDNEDTESQNPPLAQSPTVDSEAVAPVEVPAKHSSRGRRSSNRMCGRKPRPSSSVSQSSDMEPDPCHTTQKTSPLSTKHSEAASLTQSAEVLRTLESLPLTIPISTSSADTPSKFLRLEEVCGSRESSALVTLKTIQDPLDIVLRSSVPRIDDDPGYLNALSTSDSPASSRCISSIPTHSEVAVSSAAVRRVDGEAGFSYARLLKSSLEVLHSEEESEGEDAGRLIIDSGSAHNSRTSVAADPATIPSNTSHRSNYPFSSPVAAEASFLPPPTSSTADVSGRMDFSETLQPPPPPPPPQSVINCNHLIQNSPFPIPPPRIIPYSAMDSDASWT